MCVIGSLGKTSATAPIHWEHFSATGLQEPPRSILAGLLNGLPHASCSKRQATILWYWHQYLKLTLCFGAYYSSTRSHNVGTGMQAPIKFFSHLCICVDDKSLSSSSPPAQTLLETPPEASPGRTQLLKWPERRTMTSLPSDMALLLWQSK